MMMSHQSDDVTFQVFVQVQESNVTLEWTEPFYGFAEDILQHYCLYSVVSRTIVLIS